MSKAEQLAASLERSQSGIYEAAALLRAQDALLKQALEALEPHKSTVLRWYTPTDAAIDAIKEHLNEQDS